MVKGNYMIKMVILNMQVILIMIILKGMENIFTKMEIITLGNLKIVLDTVKEFYMIKMLI